MLRLGIAGAEWHVIDDREIRRGDISYTIDTVSDLQAEFPADELVLIIGADSLASMRQWKDPERLLRQVTLGVVHRGGDPSPDFSVLQGIVDADRIHRFEQHVIQMPLIELSSSELRSRLAREKSIRYRTPRAVEALIYAKRLYH